MKSNRRGPLRGACALLLLPLFVLQACRGGTGESAGDAGGARNSGGEAGEAGSIRIVLVTHGQSSDPFWSVVSTGAREAAEELGVRVEYQAPGTFSMVEMSQLIEAVVASGPDGLAVSIPDGNALGPSIHTALEAGVPVISLNSGDDVFRELGLHTHIGQPEYEAGYAAGERLVAAGVGRALCVNHEVGNVALDARCRGLEDAIIEGGGSARVLSVDLADPEDAQQRIVGALIRAPGLDGILTLGPAGAVPALAALEASGREKDLALGTFDLSMRVLEAIRDGRMRFAIDQQPYLQGYLAVVLLTKLIEIGVVPEGVIRSGPAFVTADNVAAVIGLVERGVR